MCTRITKGCNNSVLNCSFVFYSLQEYEKGSCKTLPLRHLFICFELFLNLSIKSSLLDPLAQGWEFALGFSSKLIIFCERKSDSLLGIKRGKAVKNILTKYKYVESDLLTDGRSFVRSDKSDSLRLSFFIKSDESKSLTVAIYHSWAHLR